MQQKIKKICGICAILMLFCTAVLSAPSKDEIYFMPYEQAQALNALKNAFKNAKREIKISIYSFTNNEIAKTLRDSAKRGVKIHIIYDKESNIKNSISTIGYLAKYNNISVCLLSGIQSRNKRFYGIMHQKMAIVDGELLVIGSANWSKNAFENNFETLFLTSNKDLVQKSLKAYDKMMNACVGF